MNKILLSMIIFANAFTIVVSLPICSQLSSIAQEKFLQVNNAIADSSSLVACSQEQGVRITKNDADKVYKASKLLEKKGNKFEFWDTPHGRFWVVSNNFYTLAWVLAEQEANIYGDQSKGVRSGDIVLDCGAHFGGYTRVALNKGAKLVVAIEIAPENIECLRQTFAAEIVSGKVIVYPQGVWDKDDKLILQQQDHTWGDSIVMKGKKEGPVVLLTTIDKIVTELGLARVDFIKADIEGAERNALLGATKTLERFKPRMAIAAYHLKDDKSVLPTIARKAQPAYKACLQGVGWGNETILFE